MKARVVTVHLVIVEDESSSEHERVIDTADAISATLVQAEASGLLLDWGYAKGGTPESGPTIDATDYEEGDLFVRARLDKNVREVL